MENYQKIVVVMFVSLGVYVGLVTGENELSHGKLMSTIKYKYLFDLN